MMIKAGMERGADGFRAVQLEARFASAAEARQGAMRTPELARMVENAFEAQFHQEPQAVRAFSILPKAGGIPGLVFIAAGNIGGVTAGCVERQVDALINARPAGP